MSTFDAPERLGHSPPLSPRNFDEIKKSLGLQILLIALIPTSAVDVTRLTCLRGRGAAVARLISELLSGEALAVA